MNEDIELIYWALVSYCEDCLGDDKAERKRIDEAWMRIVGACGERAA